jgi:hypothetical protein
VRRRHETAGSERLAHLGDREIERYACSGSDADEDRLIEQHIAACRECLQRVKFALASSR